MATAAKPRRRRVRTRGALAVIGALLIASAVLRTGIGASEAWARGIGTDIDPVLDTVDPILQEKRPIERIVEEDFADLLRALERREDRVKKRERDIEIRMKALSVAEEEIQAQLVILERAERELRDTMALAATAAEDDITRLTEVYANMKPKQAAALFEEMDPEFSAGFLGRMRPDAAAAIMAGLSPSVAYTISVVLAGRNAEVPTE